MRVLVTSQPGLGHLNGVVALARELAARGHDVLAAGAPSVRRAFETAGLHAVAVVAEPIWSDSARTRAELPELQHVSPPERLAVLHAELGIRRRAADLVPALTELVRDRRPDVVLRDATELAGWVVAERHDLPQVPFEVSVHWSEERWNTRVGWALRELRTLAGLPGGGDDPAAGMYRHLHLNNAPRALLEPDVALPSTSADIEPRFFEQYAEPAPEQRPTGHAYVACGSVYQPPSEVLEPVLRTLSGTFPLVIAASTERFDDDRLYVRPYVPQSPCMPGCSVVLCHGGRSTVLTALAHGVPVVCAPIGSDHFQVARLVERAGAGLVCAWDRDELLRAVCTVADDPRFAAGARTVAAQVGAMPSVADVAALLEVRFG